MTCSQIFFRTFIMVLIAAAVCVIGTGVASAEPVEEWNKTFGGTGEEIGHSVQQTSDGGYIITGYTNSYGAVKGDLWLVKTDASGVEMWSKTLGGEPFGGTYMDVGYSVQQTSDGGYIITGYTMSHLSNNMELWLVKTDASGNKMWEKTFSSGVGYSVQQTSDGGYIITGYTTSYGAGHRDLFLVKTDASGEQIWSKTFGGADLDNGYSVQQTSDGGYIITGETVSYGAGKRDLWLVKTDASGTQMWNKTFGGTDNDAGYSVQQTSDGGYVITGIKGHGRGNQPWLVKTDASGKKMWDKTFGGDSGYSVQQTSDGGYIITGANYDSGDNLGDLSILKTDASGKKMWEKAFGRTDEDYGRSVQQTSDGGYIITGHTMSYGAGERDLWLVKVSSEAVQPTTIIKSSEYSNDMTVFEKIMQYISNTVFKNKTTTAVSFIALILIVVVAYGYVRNRD